MLSKLGYDPDTAQKRLGDGFYEQRLIQQAVLARTGQRFIDGQTSDADLFKHLMDNAIGSKSALNLSVGVSLTAEQVAALTHDIVWLENATVAGQQVLVPVLYLAQANNRLAPNGALISGTDVNLITGSNLNNAGTLRATGSLLANIGGSFTNSGLMEAGGRLDVLTGNNLTNRAGGVISAGNVNLAAGADLLNERSVTTHESASNYRTERSDFVDSAARIESANDLSMQAGGNVNNIGGVLKSGADTTVKAVGDVNITASKSLDSGAIGNRSSFTTIAQQGSVVDAGRDLHVIGGRDISAIASQVEAKRDVNLIATRDLNAIAAANEQHSTYNSKKIKSIEDHVQQVSSVIKAGGDATLSAGLNLQLVASQVNAGNEAYLVSGKNLELKAAENQDYSFYSKTKKTSQGKKFRLDETDVVNNVGSLVSAGTNSTVVAGTDLLLAGSAVTAEKGATQLVAGQDVKILAVSNADSARHERKESKSSWGGLKSSKVQDKVDEKRTTAVGSMVSGETVTVAAKRDATVTGSNLVSTGDLAVQAGRDLTIDAAQNTFARTDMHKEKNRDLTGVLTGNKLGLDDMTGNQKLYINSSKHNGTANEMTLTGSTIGSSAGNVSLTAGRELKVVASDLVSTKNMELSGANVTVTSGMETASQTSKDSSKSLAVGRVIAGSVVDTATSMRDAVKAARSADDPRLKAVKIAQAALAAYNLNGQASDANAQSSGFKNKTGGTPGNGSLIKIGTELANNRSKNSSEFNSATAKQSTLNAGQDLSIVATGAAAGTQGDIQITGSSLKAANTLLLAKNDVLMQSAQNTTDRKNEGSKNKTAIGASFNIGEQNGFTLDLGAQGAKNNGNGNSVTQVNSTLDTGSLLLQSGGDTTLKGAQVRADRIKADIGGNLNIISLQDTESSRSKQSSAGFGASICVPPFCYGSTVAGSANLAAANMNSDYKGVTDQSGLYAGTGGYDINVGKNTTLQGAVIASEASADKNRLSTDRLIVSDIKNVSEIKSQSAGISVSSSSTSGASMGGSIPIALKEKDHSYTRSAVSEGTIVVRSAEGANDLVGLNRDTANANQKLDRPDEKAMQERIDLIQSSAQLASGVISAVGKAKADEAKALADEAKKQTEAGSPDAAGTVLAANAAYTEAQRWQVGGDKRLMADIASGLIAAGLGGAPVGTTVGIVANTASSDIFNKIGDYAQSRATDPKSDAVTRAAWAEGGAARLMLHALAGAAIGLSSGNVQSGALGAGASAALMPSIADALGKNGIRGSEQETLAALVALGVGASVDSNGTTAGAVVAGSTATAVEQYNRQAHPTEARLIQKEADKLAAEAGISPAEAERRMAAALASYTDKTWNATVEKAGESQFDPLTLKHLGEALAPLGAIYENSALYPEGTSRAYNGEETLSLLKNYGVTHSGDFKDGSVNLGYLDDPSLGLVDFYKNNLDYRGKVPGGDEGKGSAAGVGLSLLGTAQSIGSLFKIAFGGNSLDEANKVLSPFVEPSSGLLDSWMTKDAQSLVSGLQNNTYEEYLRKTQLSADLLQMGLPGLGQLGRLRQMGKAGEAAKAAEAAKLGFADGKLLDEFADVPVAGKGAIYGPASAGDKGFIVVSTPAGDVKLPEWYRVDGAAGADFVSFDNALADGAQRIINSRTGNFEVLGADGLVYFNGPNGLVPKAGGTLAVLAEAERRIVGAKATAGSVEKQTTPSFSNQFPDHPTGVPTLISETKLTQGAGRYNYVVLQDGQLVIGRKFNDVGGGHIDLANGKPVVAAGEVKIVNGEVKYIDNTSGHYEPSGRAAQAAAEDAFSRKGLDVGGKYIEKVWVPDSSDSRKGAWVPK